MLAEMLAGGLNANLGGREQMPIVVERQIVALDARTVRVSRVSHRSVCDWFVHGQSDGHLDCTLSRAGQGSAFARLARATSTNRLLFNRRAWLHRSRDGPGRAGTNHLRKIPVDKQHRMRVDRLAEAIEKDKQAGTPTILCRRNIWHCRCRRYR